MKTDDYGGTQSCFRWEEVNLLLICVRLHFSPPKNTLREEDFSTEVKEDEPEWELCNPISMCI